MAGKAAVAAALIIGVLLGGAVWREAPDAWAQPNPRAGLYRVTVEARSGTDGIVIGGERYTIVQGSRILDRQGNPTTIGSIFFPTDASVNLSVGPDGTGTVDYLKVENFPK